mmetsp:Transcript_61003/g.145366  ORF Transcript_61003/g.145366 Transcript_61003/m.145366 type:complete len:416 (+) Transcript_61003:98-1345(+)|eukprot:CAMPEP_0178446182 /NCGR_PEP_ID=MMETSP0689_2-20121128/40644_1 /TAXON_ID=160604 /ORGANISM="Amphidinium massartii, Strain CS-259" /LENGTH=415 /DNA_ID=CAMNT_0020070943 /DNA_START=97 /DNA_END=1344 /DNA_ORIENTATION=-
MLQESREVPEDTSSPQLESSSAAASASGAPAAPSSPDKSSEAPAAFQIGTPPQSHLEPRSGSDPRSGGKDWSQGMGSAPPVVGGEGAPRLFPFVPADRSASAMEDLAENTREFQRRIGEAFPVDKMQNGLNAARGFMSWGFGRVAEKATKIGDDIADSEFAKETTRRLAEAEVVVSQQVNEASKMAEAGISRARTNLEQMQQDLQPTLNETQDRVREAATGIAEQVEPLAEKVRPHVEEAKEAAKTGIFTAFSNAAKTAIWFQSLGASNMDSEEEDEEFARSPLGEQAEASAAPVQAPMQMAPAQVSAPADTAVASASAAQRPSPPLAEADPEVAVPAVERQSRTATEEAAVTPKADSLVDMDSTLPQVATPSPTLATAPVVEDVSAANTDKIVEEAPKEEILSDVPAIAAEQAE